MNISLKNISAGDPSTENHKISLFLKYTVTRNSLLKDLNLLNLN